MDKEDKDLRNAILIIVVSLMFAAACFAEGAFPLPGGIVIEQGIGND